MINYKYGTRKNETPLYGAFACFLCVYYLVAHHLFGGSVDGLHMFRPREAIGGFVGWRIEHQYFRHNTVKPFVRFFLYLPQVREQPLR